MNRIDGFNRAVANNDISMVRTLLTDRIDQIKMNQAVFLAINASNEMMSFLVAHHADVNTINDQGFTPLMVACKELNAPMVRSLLGNGAQASLIVNGVTALLCVIAHQASSRNNNASVSVGNALSVYQVHMLQVEIAMLLLNHGAQPNDKTRKGHTILMDAVKTSCNALIPVLLSAGARIDMTDKEGNTALHHACMARNENAMRILLSFGANPQAMNIFSDTPLRLVKEHAKMAPTLKENMIALFKKYGVQ